MKTVQESNKKSFREKIFSTRSLFIVFILLPVLIVGIGFSAWSTITPTFGGLLSSNVTSERLIDTSALMSIEKFEPYTRDLFFTGAVGEDGKLEHELHIESSIKLNAQNIYTIAKECGQNDLYLTLTLSLKSGNECPIFWDLNEGTSDFSMICEEKSQNGSNSGGESTSMTVKTASVQPTPTTSSVTLLLVVSFNDLTKESNPFSESDKLSINPEFVLNAHGYPTFFDLAKEQAQFRLELSLTESMPN